ncbi:hypothetical protein P153DRAFT_3330 [Dothidotthia symphoricarpi CBS 119687]|uniref:Uncharacterized protein n=1 Tax=Dothidotthia symphoricarpi CBS 119687 TaxID=1392245 RepID=A0A6A6ARF5_9PLEO|nr:uncharacterized protein P153DRAFT_3330 [Dothidotthia symphoricarpi CBS 119687]KAF2134519.1 hypothetical protein P153DRAFT_3330 [Dothidotthia symphoricarpi CBS 119687]
MALQSQHPLLLATAIAHAFLALGHTSKGLEQFKHPSLNTLPATLRGAVQIGWFEGSGFFLLMSILNYKWAQVGLLDVYDKSIAALLVSLLVGAGASYIKSGDKSTAGVLIVVGILQSLGIKSGASL